MPPSYDKALLTMMLKRSNLFKVLIKFEGFSPIQEILSSYEKFHFFSLKPKEMLISDYQESFHQ